MEEATDQGVVAAGTLQFSMSHRMRRGAVLGDCAEGVGPIARRLARGYCPARQPWASWDSAEVAATSAMASGKLALAAWRDSGEGAQVSEGRPQDTGAVDTTERAGLAAGERPVFTRRALVVGTSVVHVPPAGTGAACPLDDAWARVHTEPRAGRSAPRRCTAVRAELEGTCQTTAPV